MYHYPSVRHSVHSGDCPMWPLPMMHCTSLCSPPLLSDIGCGDLLPPPNTGHGTPWPPFRYGTWIPPPPPIPALLPFLVISGDHRWRPVQTCSVDLTVQALSPTIMTSGGHHTVGKQAVCILLECFVFFRFNCAKVNDWTKGTNMISRF